ncbi:MAG: SpaA isopeptide-forming pilin-related protein, partial [Anaerococcus sp.]|nr:SpaA isopeptide-forming pilin-related protein [Anaerococcus sp.]
PDYDENVYRKTSKGQGGDFKFEQIPEGIYILEEINAPKGYQKANKYILQAKKETVNAIEKVLVKFIDKDDANLKEVDGKNIITNQTKKTEVKFRKLRREYLADTKNDHLGLADAKFRLMSLKTIDGDFYLEEAYTDNTRPTETTKEKVDNQQAEGGGYVSFKDLTVGEYLLQELEAPKGYKKTDLYGWKLVISESEGKFAYKLYEVPKAKEGEDQNKILNSDTLTEVKLFNLEDKDKENFQIGNESRKISIHFDKYLTDGTAAPVKANKKLVDDTGNPVEFDLYKADYYGAIIGDKINDKPIVQNIAKTDSKDRIFKDPKYDYSFELHDLEFGGYYVLKEKNPPAGYKTASSILLKVEAEAIANEGHMKVIVRDPNPNAKTDDHSVFFGVIDFEKKTKLGEFSIKKVGKAIGYEGNVGLRRAYFRLYTADKNFEIEYKDPDKKYPKEYIQKVTPGVPITHEEGGKQVGTDPKDLPKNQGIVTFDQLKPGNYVLEEYRGPAGYEKDPGKWYITVDTDGTVKKYREIPGSGTGSRQVLYSMQNPRYKMAGLNISENLPINRLMGPQGFTGLEKFENSYSENNLNIKVSGSDVDTRNGKRNIDIYISPQDVPGQGTQKNLQYVFLIDRSQDSSTKKAAADAPNIDRNINKFLTDLAKKAKDNNTKVDVTFIEYSRSIAGNYDAKNRNKSKLLGTYNQDLIALYDNASSFTYNMKTQGFDEKNPTTAKDILGQVGISTRETITKSKDDGSRGLSENINTHYNQIISNGKKYDKRIVLNIANFEAASADFYYEVPNNPRSQKKYYIADNNWPFRDPGKQDKDKIFDSYVLHIEQKSSQETDYEKYMRTNSGTWYIDKNENPQQGLFTYKNFLESNLLKDEYFKASQKDGYLIKGATLNLSLNSRINLISASANVTDASGQTIIKNLTPTTSKVEQFHSISLANIDLKKNESLKLSYTIDLKNTADYNTSYYINKDKITFTNGTKETYISRINPNTGVDIMTKKIKATPNNYNVTLESTGNGNVTVDKATGLSEGTDVTITTTPKQGYKLNELKVINLKTNEDITVTNNKFKMPAANVKITATFEPVTIISQGKIDLKTVFTYSNQKDGEDDSDPAPIGKAGTIRLYVKEDSGVMPASWIPVGNPQNAPYKGELTLSMPASWIPVGNSQDVPYKGEVTFPGLDGSKEYKLEYTREESNASLWGTETTTTIDVDLSKPEKRPGQNDLKTITISNGNLMEIFNKDETGFRIPLRITKVNENKGALTGSQFKARKILNGDKSLYKEINKKIVKTGESKDYPIYHDEKFDGVSEATGEPGDNYFRELTPGIYELTEIKAPDGTYRIPKDENGKPMKWYFQVFVYEGRDPRGADYMGINFNFEHTFTDKDDFNKDNVNEAEKAKLIGTTIEGLGSDKAKFNKYIKVIPDDGRSNPARPDAPYQGINDAQVTNYKSKTNLSFFKKDLETHKNLKDAEFTLRKVKIQTVDENGKKVEKPVLGTNNKPVYADDKTTDDKGKEYTDDQLKELMVQPYHKDKDKVYALAKSTENLGVEFTNIAEGTYILEETKPAAGYKPTDSFLTITFTEAEDGSWKQVVKGYKKVNDKYVEMDSKDTFFSKDKSGKLVSIANQKKYINLKFNKIRAKKGADNKEIHVNTASFKLTQVDEDGKDLPGGKQWDEQHNFSSNEFNFTNLGVGHYKLEETKAIDEFEKPDPWFFEVKDDKNDPGKLKIVFKKASKSISFKQYENSELIPEIDEKGNPVDLKIKNYSRINFKFQKLSDQKVDGKQIPLKDAVFSLKKLRYSTEDKAKAYEYYESKDKATSKPDEDFTVGALKKYSHGDQVTEFYNSGTIQKFTKAGKVYEFDESGKLIKVDGKAATRQDQDDLKNKKVIPDSVSAATGKYYQSMRSQSDGGVSFGDLGEGIYELTETKIPEGYQSANKQFSWIFKVEKGDDGLEIKHDRAFEKAYYEKFGISDSSKYKKEYSDSSNVKESKANEFSYEITNTKSTTDLKWKKVTKNQKDQLVKQRTQFWLFKVSDDPTDPKVAESGQSSFAPYQVESINGQFEINDLSKGIYTLVETIAPDGYKKMQRQIVIKIYEDEKDGYKLKQKFYEMKREKVEGKDEYKNVLVKTPQEFTNLLTQGVTTSEVALDTDA